MKLRHDKYDKIYNLLNKYQIIIYSKYQISYGLNNKEYNLIWFRIFNLKYINDLFYN